MSDDDLIRRGDAERIAIAYSEGGETAEKAANAIRALPAVTRAPVEVCPECDIAGCHHIRERQAKPAVTLATSCAFPNCLCAATPPHYCQGATLAPKPAPSLAEAAKALLKALHSASDEQIYNALQAGWEAYITHSGVQDAERFAIGFAAALRRIAEARHD